MASKLRFFVIAILALCALEFAVSFQLGVQFQSCHPLEQKQSQACQNVLSLRKTNHKSSITMLSKTNTSPKFTAAVVSFFAGLTLAASVVGLPTLADAKIDDMLPVTSAAAQQSKATTCSGKHWSEILLATTEDTGGGFADLPPCLPWSSGPCVSVNGPCFAEDSGCGPSFKACTKDKDCVKGLGCLARCGGDPTCSTGCFAAFGDDTLTGFLSCALEGKECINFPKDPAMMGWVDDGPDAPEAVQNFDMTTLQGDWFKVLGLDSRYDCFECQQNRFRKEGSSGWRMDTTFRLPRFRGETRTAVEPPLAPNTFKWPSNTAIPDAGYFQNDLTEEVLVDAPGAKPTMHTTGKTFGLTFWENYYIVGQGPDFQFVRYVGHTLQGGYKGAFILARSMSLSPESMQKVEAIAKEQGLDIKSFCRIKNQACGTREAPLPVNDLDDFVGDAKRYVKFMFDRQEKL